MTPLGRSRRATVRFGSIVSLRAMINVALATGHSRVRSRRSRVTRDLYRRGCACKSATTFGTPRRSGARRSNRCAPHGRATLVAALCARVARRSSACRGTARNAQVCGAASAFSRRRVGSCGSIFPKWNSTEPRCCSAPGFLIPIVKRSSVTTELRRIGSIIAEQQPALLKAWHEYFAK